MSHSENYSNRDHYFKNPRTRRFYGILSYGRADDIFNPTCNEKSRVIYHVHYQKCHIFMTWGKLGHLGPQTKFCGTVGQSSLKLIKPQLSWENQDKWDSHINVLVTI
jgi:hypothetical protein